MIAGINEEKAKIYLISIENGTLKSRELSVDKIEEFLKAGVDVRVAEAMLL